MISRNGVFLLLAFAVSASAQAYVPGVEREDYDTREGTDLVMAYFGSSTCGWCVRPEGKKAVEAAKLALLERATREGKTFVALGAALDHSVADGLGFLSVSGAFDEIAVGRNWFNSASLAHLWRPEGLEDRIVAEPTIVVFERDMTMGDVITAGAPRYRAQMSGTAAITAWLDAGALLE